MENQVEQLKLNVTNIKSVLINSNAKLKKINSQKSSIVRTEAQKEKKAAAEKNIESVKVPGSGIIGGVVGRIKGIATSFFDKILNFAGYVLLGFIVTKLPEIIEAGKKVYNFVKPIWDGVASTIKVIIKGAGFIVGGFQKAFSIFNPSKESTKIESMKKEIDKLDGELDVDDVPEESVVTPTVQKDTSGSTSAAAPTPVTPAPVSSSPVKLPVIPFQKRNKGGSVTKTTQPNQDPWKYDQKSIIMSDSLRPLLPKVTSRFTNNILFYRKNVNDLERLIKSGAFSSGFGSGSGSPASEYGSIPLGSGETAKGSQLLDGLVKRGFNKEEAAAIVGNLWAESGFRTGAVNPSSGAYGLMQWLGGRKDRLVKYAEEKGKSAADLDLQLDYIRWELAGGNSYETAQFRRAMSYGSDVASKTKGFAYEVERAGAHELSSSMSKRIGAAQSVYSSGGGTGGGSDIMDYPYSFKELTSKNLVNKKDIKSLEYLEEETMMSTIIIPFEVEKIVMV